MIPRGLAGVQVDTTRISDIDGEKGKLRYRGYAIDALATRPFADVVALVLDGELPANREPIVTALKDRTLPAAVKAVLRELPKTTHTMTMLQVTLPLLGERGAEPRAELLAIAAKVPTLVASWICLCEGRAIPDPDLSLSLHADFLRMARGKSATADEVALMDALQILQMEHGFNASTFTARVVASTLASLPTTLSAAVGALYGPLHGGADEAAYRMAVSIGDPERAAAWVDDALKRKEKIMGLGHREYKVVDPRAVVLRKLAERVAPGAVLRTLAAVDDHASRRFAAEGKTIRANVEFYKGAVFASLGIAPAHFTALFVMARIYGWGAHVLELWEDNKLYRPAAAYSGAAPRVLA